MKNLVEMTEQELLQEIQQLIESAPKEYRLEQLQWKCDMIRQKYGDNHTGAVVEINGLMLESLHKLNQALKELSDGLTRDTEEQDGN